MSVVTCEAIDVGSVFDGLTPIKLIPFRVTNLVNITFRLSFLCPVPSEVPLSDYLGVVTRFLQKVSNSCALCGDEMITRPTEDAAGKARTPVVAPCQNAIARRSTNRTGRMRIKKGNSLLC